MKFNKILRGAARAANEATTVFEILDDGFLCHIAFQSGGQTMIIPTAYGRQDEALYFHGSAKNQMLNAIVDGQTICVSVTHLDGLVLARTLFDTSVNYRSAVLFGKAEVVTDESEKIEGLRVITENIIEGRWAEVSMGSATQLKATMVVKFHIDRASAKVRTGPPAGDEGIQQEVWSGHIPLSLTASEPVRDSKFGVEIERTASVRNFYHRYQK